MRDCGTLQFLLEQPVICWQGIELQTIDTYRITIDTDGAVELIEQEQPGGYWTVPKTHPLHAEVLREVDSQCQGLITETLIEYAGDAPARRADRAYEQRY